jgi:type I restriction enzyme, S subunit
MTKTARQWTTWSTADLIRERVLDIGDGYRAKNGEMGSEGLPFARAGNIDGGFQLESADILDQRNVPRAGDKISRSGDVVFTSKGTVGRFAFVKDDTPAFVYSPQLCYWRVLRPSVVHPRYLFYWMQSSDFLNQVQRVKGLTDMADYVSLSDQRRMTLRAPAMPVQIRLVSILSAYDDLIENNTRRIKILEKMAQMICREWFVNFRFPGHELVKMVESEVGPIPMGWRAGLLRDLCESIDYGYTASAVDEPIGPKFLRITDIVPDTIDWPSVPYCPQPDRNPQKYRLLEGDIVVARTGATTGYAKRLNKRHPVSIFASYLVRLRIKSEHSNTMAGLLLESEDYKKFITANLGGAAQPQANAQILASKPVAIPPSELQARFSSITEPLLDQKEILQIKNTNLRQTRDLLLPKLISGEVEVENFETEAVAQGV